MKNCVDPKLQHVEHVYPLYGFFYGTRIEPTFYAAAQRGSS